MAPAPQLGAHQVEPWSRPREAITAPNPPEHDARSFCEGLRVVDLTHAWSGAAVTRTLADLGADVVRVERPTEPEGARGVFPAGDDGVGDSWNRAPSFAARQAGTRSIALDLDRPEGRELLHRLIEGADALVAGFTARVLGSLGLDYERLCERYPRLVMVSISGFGQDGPRADDPALGTTIEAASGVSAATGYAGAQPIQAGNGLGDALAEMHAAAGLLARERTGRRQHVDVSSIQEVVLQLAAPQLMDELLNGRRHGPAGNRRPGVVRGTYPCAGHDAWVALTAEGDEAWAALCCLVGQPDCARDPRFASVRGRHEHHAAIDERIAAWTHRRPQLAAMEELLAAGWRPAPCSRPTRSSRTSSSPAGAASTPSRYPAAA